MSIPIYTGLTAGILILLQMLLMAMTAIGRGKHQLAIGDGGKDDMLRLIRRHGNLAENAALFIAGLGLLELQTGSTTVVGALCAVFVIGRVLHAVGFSLSDTRNFWRIAGAAGTMFTGFVLGIALIWHALTVLVS